MPYIGKSPVGGGFHKLDNLTASATATYALTLGGAAYYPETANQLLVSLNGVIQAPQDSFTVSGSNLVFDSALTASDSIDFVVALGDVLGVGTPTDGSVTTAKIGNGAVDLTSKVTGILPVANGGTGSSSVYISRFALTSNLTSDGDITNWSAPTVSNQVASIGTAVTVSSGVFTFPVTGVWKIQMNGRVLGSNDTTVSINLFVSTDGGSTFTNYANGVNGGDVTTTGNITFADYINVDDVSNIKVKFTGSSIATGSYVFGKAISIGLSTWVNFERITDAQ